MCSGLGVIMFYKVIQNSTIREEFNYVRETMNSKDPYAVDVMRMRGVARIVASCSLLVRNFVNLCKMLNFQIKVPTRAAETYPFETAQIVMKFLNVKCDNVLLDFSLDQ